MKKSLLLIVLLLAVCLIFIGYTFHNEEYSKAAEVGKKNVQRFQEVQTGMDSLTVLKIMGNSSERYVSEGDIFYNYEVPPGSSFQCQIVLNKRGKVTFKSGVPNQDNN